MRRSLWHVGLVLAGVGLFSLSGCLSSCWRRPSFALLPSDSLSVQVAAQIPVSLLTLQWESNGDSLVTLSVPRTVRFSPDARYIYVADADRNQVLVFNRQGARIRLVRDRRLHWPFISGWRGDSLVLYQPTAHVFVIVHKDKVVRTFPAPEGPYTYTTAYDAWLYFKAVGESFKGYVTRLDDTGKPIPPRVALEGPFWRFVGPLDMGQEVLYSFCAYRPVVDRIFPDGRHDTLALVGFDSPQLARSRLFMEGEISEPPLLIPAGRVRDSLLFVLNMRSGWVRIDAYDLQGRLKHVFEPDSVGFASNFYPIDLDVVPAEGGAYEAAVVFIRPKPMLRLYRLDPRVRLEHQERGVF